MRNKVIVILALVFALLAAFSVYFFLNNVKKEAENRQYTQVITAFQDIPANTPITDAMVELKPFPTELLNGQELLEKSMVVGKISPMAISKGEVLLQNRLIKLGESTGQLSYIIPAGYRAMSIPIDEITGVANLVKKGDRVDIIGVVPAGNVNPLERSVLILQNVEVLAVGKVLNSTIAANPEENKAAASITLAVDPQSSLKLKLAIDKTSYTLTLRPAAEKNVVNPAPVDINQF